MRRIEKYLFRQLLIPTLVATAALGGVALLSSTLANLGLMVDQRQTAWVFAKIVVISSPQLLALIIPIALFVAALLTLNRLHTEQEIVVCYAGGMTRWQVMSPFFRVATWATLLMIVLNLWVSPASYRAVREEMFKIRTDLAASLVREGTFTQPAQGLTVYAQSADQQGQLRNLFIQQQRANGETNTFTAKFGLITKRNGEPVLVMRQGSSQQFNAQGVLTYLAFDEYVFDLTPYLNTQDVLQYKPSDRYLHELLFPEKTHDWKPRDLRRMTAEVHYRLSAPLYNFTFLALALWAVIGGPFNRTGYGGRIARAAAAAAVLRILGFTVQTASENAEWLNLLQYLVPAAPAWYLFRRMLRPVIRSETVKGLDLLPLSGSARA